MRVRSFFYNADATAGGGGEAAAEVAQPVADTPAVEPEASAPVVEEGAGTSAAKEDTPAADPLSAWTGELEQIGSQPWFGSLPTNAKDVVREGLRAKHATWESGYGKKFQEAADLRKTATAELETIRREHAAEVKRLRDDSALLADLFGNEDGKATQEHFETKMAEREAAYQAEKNALESELGTLRTFRETATKQAKDAYEAAVSQEATRMKAAYADILTNDAAADKFERLIAAGEEESDAASYVREKFIPKAAKVPAAAANAAAGDGPHAATAAPAGMSMDERLQWAVNRASQTLGHG